MVYTLQLFREGLFYMLCFQMQSCDVHGQRAAAIQSQISFKPQASMYHVPVQLCERANLGKLYLLTHPGSADVTG